MTEVVSCLDKGYVRLIDTMGSDISVANSARVSFDKKSELNEDGSLKERDAKLIKFLWENEHTAPFRHATLTFEVSAPLMIARQHWKHHVASTYVDDQNGWNEMSKRYVTEIPEFYLPAPNQWRSKPENSKQGSGVALADMDVIEWGVWRFNNYDLEIHNEHAESFGNFWTDELEEHIRKSEDLYESAMANGICAEQARLFLPAYGMYIKYYWTVSLHGLMNFLSLRLPKDAQVEIQTYAKAIRTLAEQAFPASIGILDV